MSAKGAATRREEGETRDVLTDEQRSRCALGAHLRKDLFFGGALCRCRLAPTTLVAAATTPKIARAEMGLRPTR